LSFAGKWFELENIILSEVNQDQKAKITCSLICGIQAQYKYKQYCIYIEIYTEHVYKNETGKGDQRRRKER
jgi:hypothetical protein